MDVLKFILFLFHIYYIIFTSFLSVHSLYSLSSDPVFHISSYAFSSVQSLCSFQAALWPSFLWFLKLSSLNSASTYLIFFCCLVFLCVCVKSHIGDYSLIFLKFRNIFGHNFHSVHETLFWWIFLDYHLVFFLFFPPSFLSFPFISLYRSWVDFFLINHIGIEQVFHESTIKKLL